MQKTENIKDPMKKALALFMYQYHPSLTNFKDITIVKSKNISSFIFQPVSIDKACPDVAIPMKFYKMNEDIFSRLIFQNFNESLVNSQFPLLFKTS